MKSPSLARAQLSRIVIDATKRFTRRFGYEIARYRPRNPENQLQDVFLALARLRDLRADGIDGQSSRFLDFCCNNFALSRSQIFQDLFVQHHLGEKAGGFFVEFGATNGIDLSNTYLLEKHYAWKGILAEPAKIWHSPLVRNRQCTLDFRCVWDKSGERVDFNETSGPEFSTVNTVSPGDAHVMSRRSREQYSVETISLNDLLEQHGAPREIDYLSVDTEGSELRILSGFDFSKYDVKIITVEHNYTPERAELHALLRSNGFQRYFEHLSMWDDWYVRS